MERRRGGRILFDSSSFFGGRDLFDSSSFFGGRDMFDSSSFFGGRDLFDSSSFFGGRDMFDSSSLFGGRDPFDSSSLFGDRFFTQPFGGGMMAQRRSQRVVRGPPKSRQIPDPAPPNSRSRSRSRPGAAPPSSPRPDPAAGAPPPLSPRPDLAGGAVEGAAALPSSRSGGWRGADAIPSSTEPPPRSPRPAGGRSAAPAFPSSSRRTERRLRVPFVQPADGAPPPRSPRPAGGRSAAPRAPLVQPADGAPPPALPSSSRRTERRPGAPLVQPAAGAAPRAPLVLPAADGTAALQRRLGEPRSETSAQLRKTSFTGPGELGDLSDGFIRRSITTSPPPQAPARGNGTRPVITEIDDEEGENGERADGQPNHESNVQEPDDGNDGMQGGQVQLRRDFDRANSGQPQARTFTYQSSSVTYGGVNGAYYTASKTRRSGSDGITVEESKEADTTTKEATHRISRGIHDKGHSLTRKLKSDGKVDSTQILHNLNEDELPGFEESWKGNARQHLGWNQNAGVSNDDNSGNRGANGRGGQPTRRWALPGTERTRDPRTLVWRPKSGVIPIS